eukprot:scaffold607473_cov32-Prasinocladus_malaysianus.AAC.1
MTLGPILKREGRVAGLDETHAEASSCGLDMLHQVMIIGSTGSRGDSIQSHLVPNNLSTPKVSTYGSCIK